MAARPRRERGALAVLIGCALALAASAPPVAQARCTTRLPVVATLPDGAYAARYVERIRVRLRSRVARIRNLRVELYTFGGRRMARATRRAIGREATVAMRLAPLFRPIQVGSFTLVVTGEPDASRSCGPKQAVAVLSFKACRSTLPISFPGLPGGRAADYRGYLSVRVRSRGALLGWVRSSVYGFDGSLLGTAPMIASLFGERTLDHRIPVPLAPGRYTVVVAGRNLDLPLACGRATSSRVMTFG